MTKELPARFFERLHAILPREHHPRILSFFSRPEILVIRVNTLKWTFAQAESFLNDKGVLASVLKQIPGAFELSAGAKDVLRGTPPVDEGCLYWQDASSLLPALVLDPKPGDKVLDLCAAPGSKTTQMAALMSGEGEITAVEAVRGRFFRLRSVCDLLGAKNVKTVCLDGRRFQPRDGSFDKVLVDAPCSSEGRFHVNAPDSYAYWSPRKIKEMSMKQKGLMLNASRAVAANGTLVYATCTFSPEENEAVVDWFLRKNEGGFTLETFDLPGVARYPALTSLNEKDFKNDLSACWRILPEGVFTGFFIAKFRRQP